jgi:threonine dehydrogenase-like Zn-dependent dehydrogenase
LRAFHHIRPGRRAATEDAKIERPTDVLIKITSTNICGKATPSWIVSPHLPLAEGPDGYRHFDDRDDGWTKVVLHP